MAPFFIGKNIAINCLTDIPNVETYLHFITQISNTLTSAPIDLFDKIKPIYTSAFNAWYMFTFLGVQKGIFKTVSFGIEHTVYKNGKEITFEFLTSKSNEPNFMILFKSDDGNELFTGDYKFTDEYFTIKSIQPYLSTKILNKLYFDATYLKYSRIPPLKNIIESIIATIKSHKRKIIYISANRLGNENILTVIAKALNKKIFVSPEKFLILERLGIGQFFTTEPSTTYIRTIDYSQISVKKVSKRNQLLGPSVTIVLSVKIFMSQHSGRENNEYKKNDIFLFPLTSLNTHHEIRLMKRLKTNEYVKTNKLSSSSWTEGYSNEPDMAPPPSKKLCLRSFTKSKAASRQLKNELEKCTPGYLMSWEEYIKWRKNNENSC